MKVFLAQLIERNNNVKQKETRYILDEKIFSDSTLEEFEK